MAISFRGSKLVECRPMLRAVWRAYLAASRAPSREATAAAAVALFGFARADSAAAGATLKPLVLDGRLTR